MKLKMLEVLQLDDTYTCRNEGGSGSIGSASHYQQAAGTTTLALPGAGIPTIACESNLMGQMGKFADFFMNGMKQMQESNFEMMKQLIGGSSRGELNLRGATQHDLELMMGETPNRRFSQDRPYRRNALGDGRASADRDGQHEGQEPGGENREEPREPPRTPASIERPAQAEPQTAPTEPQRTQSPPVLTDTPQTPLPSQSRPREKPSVTSIMKALDERKEDRAKETADKKAK
jgi:hypothetical protein